MATHWPNHFESCRSPIIRNHDPLFLPLTGFAWVSVVRCLQATSCPTKGQIRYLYGTSKPRGRRNRQVRIVFCVA